MDLRSPSKKLIMQGFLASGYVQVLVNPRVSDICLPQRVCGMNAVLLHYGDAVSDPSIQDLVLDDDGISATLSFNKEPFPTRVPWAAVWLIGTEGHSHVVWPDDCPTDFQQDIPAAVIEPRRARPEWLRVV